MQPDPPEGMAGTHARLLSPPTRGIPSGCLRGCWPSIHIPPHLISTGRCCRGHSATQTDRRVQLQSFDVGLSRGWGSSHFRPKPTARLRQATAAWYQGETLAGEGGWLGLPLRCRDNFRWWGRLSLHSQAVSSLTQVLK